MKVSPTKDPKVMKDQQFYLFNKITNTLSLFVPKKIFNQI